MPKRETWSDIHLLHFIRKHNVKTIGQLQALNGPRKWRFYAAFGSWREARRRAAGPFRWEPHADDVERLVASSYLITRERYRQYRKKHPERCPDERVAIKMTGCKTLGQMIVKLCGRNLWLALESLFRLTDKNKGMFSLDMLGRSDTPKKGQVFQLFTVRDLQNAAWLHYLVRHPEADGRSSSSMSAEDQQQLAERELAAEQARYKRSWRATVGHIWAARKKR